MNAKSVNGSTQHVAYDIYPDSIAGALESVVVPKEFDLLKVDVDSFECDFIEGVLKAGYRPLVITSEVNAVVVPPFKYSMKYFKDGIQYGDMVGNMLGSCSLQ